MMALYNATRLLSLALREGGGVMKRIITLVTVAAILLAAMLVVAGPASAQGGCREFGAATASLAQTGILGEVVPGLAEDGANEEVFGFFAQFCS
jgi:hypothetical protein